MQEARFLNGIYESVLEEIVKAQKKEKGLICYLQPYRTEAIKLLETNHTRLKSDPCRVYISTTKNLGRICYSAEIVGWENKQELSKSRLNFLNLHVRNHQPLEQEIYMTVNGRTCVNLISVVDLTPIQKPFSVSNLTKLDGSPLKARTTPGHWSYVHELPSWMMIKEQFDADLEDRIEAARQDSPEARANRLAITSEFPEQVQVVSIAYRRNPDVVVAIMIRANGRCERCGSPAPFLRAKDSTPYLEAHHWIPLSEGGKDTVLNAAALCPNCHREVHFGKKQSGSSSSGTSAGSQVPQ